MSLKETIFSMMLEALELGEAVEVRHDRYMRSHGKKARDSGGGSSSWMFTHKPMGDVDVKNKEEVHTAQGKFADAKKSAQQWGKQHGHSSVYVMEEVEQIDEGVKEKISGAIRREKQKEYPLLQNRRDVAATKAGSAYAAGDHKKGDRYMKWRDDNMKKEEVELDEAEMPTYHYYATKNGIGAKEMKLTHVKSKPFTSETDALKHIVKTGGRQDGIIHKVNSATGKIVQHRGIDGGQKAYPTPASDMASDAPKHVRDLKEEVNLDEVSTEKLRDYASAALQDNNKAKADKRWKYAAKAIDKVAGRDVKAAHALKYNKNEEVNLDETKTDIYHKHMLKALGKTRLPKDHNYTSAIANNGDFVVHNAGRVVGRIPKGEHDLK